MRGREGTGGGGGERETQGEREGLAAARRCSSEYGWNIVTGYEEINQSNPGQFLRQICILGAFIIEWGIHSVTEPASDFSHIPLVGNR